MNRTGPITSGLQNAEDYRSMALQQNRRPEWPAPPTPPRPQAQREHQVQTAQMLPNGDESDTRQFLYRAQQQQQHEAMRHAHEELRRIAAKYGGQIPKEVIACLPPQLKHACYILQQAQVAARLRQEAEDRKREKAWLQHDSASSIEVETASAQEFATRKAREADDREEEARLQREQDLERAEAEQEKERKVWYQSFYFRGAPPSLPIAAVTPVTLPRTESPSVLYRLGFGSVVELAVDVYPQTRRAESRESAQNVGITASATNPSSSSSSEQAARA